MKSARTVLLIERGLRDIDLSLKISYILQVESVDAGAVHGRMSRDGVVRHHLDRLTEEDLPGAIRCSDSEAGSLGRMPKFRDSGC